ncbi:MAG TPA: TIGR01244 family sulfur transferase [Allosphingosinicella sp.]
MMRRLDETTLVAGQISAADVSEAVAHGVRLVVNNRPDGEEPGQPGAAEIEAAVRGAGLDYRYIPVASGFSAWQVDAMADALERGPVLAFCRSGTRSTYLWALARSSRGKDVATLIDQAAGAGFDLSGLEAWLTR